MRWAGHEACMGERRDAFIVLVDFETHNMTQKYYISVFCGGLG
jgi:hypothetical protein